MFKSLRSNSELEMGVPVRIILSCDTSAFVALLSRATKIDALSAHDVGL